MDESMKISKEWKDGEITLSITVEKVDGGYIITKSKCGNDSGGKYISETKRSVSPKNPFDTSEDSYGVDDKWTDEADDFRLKGITKDYIG